MMKRLRLPHGTREWMDAANEGGCQAIAILATLWRMAWWLLCLPLLLLRGLAATGVWVVRAACICFFALLGMALLGQFLFGMVYVLVHPWLK